MSTSNTSTLVVLPTATITATETLTPQFSSPTPSSTSIPSPESTATEYLVISKQMLIMVNEAITGLARDEVWILSPEENIPRPLLSDQRLSISSPRGLRNGERIAFAQYPKTSPEDLYSGVMDTEGTIIQIISSSDIKSTGLLNWSADDRWLTFTTLSPDYSTAPFAVDLKTENIRNLHPHPSVRYTKGLMRPSPVENVILFAGLVEKPKLSAELWLLSLDENQAPIPIEFDMPPECGWFTDIEWSPDGKTFLVQPAAISYEHECWPRIYTYDLSNKSWSDILHAPDETRKFANLYFLAYSPDGKWLGWSSSASQNALILSTNTWEVITTIDFRGIGGFPGSPWVRIAQDSQSYPL